MQCVLIVQFLVLLVPISLQAEQTWYRRNGRNCALCPKGKFQKSCTECAPCPKGSYTAEMNQESSCRRCYGDCKPEYNLKVLQTCTSTSDVKCACVDGYSCTEKVLHTEHCSYCVKNKEATATEAAAITQGRDKHTPSPASSGRSSTSAKSCKFPKCLPTSVPHQRNETHLETDKTNRHVAAILCPVFVMVFLVLVILLYFLCHGEESCFKQAMSKLCIEGGRVVSHKPNDPNLDLPSDSFRTKQQPPPLSATNLGPVHVHNPGTVIVSLLNHFTGQVGPTIEAVKTVVRRCSEEEDGRDEEEDRRDCPVFHPTSPTSIHLSEEERSAEINTMFIPSQEQGKDCHVSKEEVL